jgi:uncharacterized SAM-binding protein YcdF (DUF218 family)
MMKTTPLYKYDAVVVLCGGLYREGNTYHATTYAHSDEFGMLGGAMRVSAAVALYSEGVSQTFLFSSGISAKHIARFGPDVPPDAKVYGDEFVQALAALEQKPNHDILTSQLEKPIVLLETKSVNTVNNVIEVAKIVAEKGWKHIALLSSDVHIGRIEALYHMMEKERPDLLSSATVEFLSAEKIMLETYPGIYDADIVAAHATPAAQICPPLAIINTQSKPVGL